MNRRLYEIQEQEIFTKDVETSIYRVYIENCYVNSGDVARIGKMFLFRSGNVYNNFKINLKIIKTT